MLALHSQQQNKMSTHTHINHCINKNKTNKNQYYPAVVKTNKCLPVKNQTYNFIAWYYFPQKQPKRTSKLKSVIILDFLNNMLNVLLLYPSVLRTCVFVLDSHCCCWAMMIRFVGLYLFDNDNNIELHHHNIFMIHHLNSCWHLHCIALSTI